MEPESFSQQDVEFILKRAFALEGQLEGQLPSFTTHQLAEMADELGISPHNLDGAIQEWKSGHRVDLDRQAFDTYRRQRFKEKAITFAIVNGFLFALDFVTDGLIDWAFFPLLIWGMFLALAAQAAYSSQGKHFDKAFRKWQRKTASRSNTP